MIRSRSLASIAIAASFAFFAGWAASPVLDQKLSPCFWGMEVIDGDTIKCHGQSLRIEGYDAPETHDPACELERAKGEMATYRLQMLMNEFDFLPKVTGLNGGHGRWTTKITVGGRDVGEMLIENGLA